MINKVSKYAELTICAVGDISFRGRHEDNVVDIPIHDLVADFKRADFSVANLESPLVKAGSVPLPGKCTLRGNSNWATVLKESGISLVTLANNHMMDYGEEGLFNTIAALERSEIAYVGAGKNLQDAQQPVFKEIAGRKAAFIGRSSVEVSSLCYAGVDQPGVAFLDEEELLDTVCQCCEMADLVVVMIHWGMEHYHYPSPKQRLLAGNIVSAGADILLGHHPHVLQGVEFIDGALVAYSSGNFLFDEFTWVMPVDDGSARASLLTLTEANRQGMMLEICVAVEGEIRTRQVFTKISADAVIEKEDSIVRQKEYKRLCSRLYWPKYDLFWKLYSMKREWDLRLSTQLSFSHVLCNLYKIRPHHFKELAVKMRRSARVSSGKSTNPYED